MTEVRRSPFPLVPRWRLAGIPFGEQRSVRRGPGSDVAGSRRYLPTDPVTAIDWRASARLSTARAADEFVVRQFYAEEAPRAVVVCDRRPSMALYPPPFSWLSKPAAAAAAAEAVAVSVLAARGEVGYVDLGDDAPYWLPPRSRGRRLDIAERTAAATFNAAPDSLARALDYLAHLRTDMPSGSFVFVVSDFLAPPSVDAWVRARALRWDVVPVIVQDPTWEQSFPDVHGVVVPFAEPGSAEITLVRPTAADAAGLRSANEQRLRALVADFRGFGIDPVVIGTSDPAAIDREFLRWAELRKQARRRSR